MVDASEPVVHTVDLERMLTDVRREKAELLARIRVLEQVEAALVAAARGSSEPSDDLKSYLPKRGSKTLKSAEMIRDVIGSFPKQPVAKQDIADAFYKRFPKEQLERFWAGDVHSTFNVALRRAKTRGLIKHVGEALYTLPGDE